MKKIKLMIIGLSVVFLATATIYARAEGGSHKRGDGLHGRIFKELNLTSEQQKKLEENRKAQREEMMKLHTAIKEKQAKLQEELRNPAVTTATVEPLVTEIKSLQAQLIEHRINGIFAVKEILTPEQFIKFQDIAEKQQKDRGRHFFNWNKKKMGSNLDKE